MIDLTVRPEDKDSFITHVYMKDEEPFFYVRYATGREEQFPFSVHNLNASLLQMETQYKQYRDEYVERVYQERLKAHVYKILEALVGIMGIYITTSLPFPYVVKAIMSTVIVVISIYYQKCQSAKVAICNTSDMVVLTADEFLRNKEKFIVKVTDPVSGNEEDWYLATLSRIEDFDSPKELRMIGDTITPDVKEEEADNANKMLKRIVSGGAMPQC